ncbi:hypothetical protein EPO15_10995, partial [bacterium]
MAKRWVCHYNQTNGHFSILQFGKLSNLSYAHMTAMLFSSLLLVSSCLAASENGGVSDKSNTLRTMFDAPRVQLGGSRDSLTSALGKIQAVEAVVTEAEFQTNRLKFRDGEALVIEWKTPDMAPQLVEFRLRKNVKKLKLPIRFGSSPAKAVDIFGPASQASKNELQYVLRGPETGKDGDRLVLGFVDDRLVSVEWHS